MAVQDFQDSSLAALVTANPGLPRPNPTDSYWLAVPHHLAEIQSPTLPEVTDVAVIGSGITGTSIAHNLLEKDSNVRVAVLEARTLCSGATGRNGGHLITYGAIMYASLKAKLGQDLAYKIVDFTFKNVDAVRDVVDANAMEESEFRTVSRIRCFDNKDDLEEAKASVAEYENDYPHESGKYTFISGEAAQKHGLHGVVGAVVFSAGALWPYRFIMKMWETNLNKHPSRLTIDAKTPVTSVLYSPEANATHEYELRTPRGTLRASKVIYAINAYTSHLIPAVRGLLFPFRSSMTVQRLDSIPNRGNNNTWSINHTPRYDTDTRRTETGSLYLQQNAKSGFFFFGGEKPTAEESFTADDSQLSATSTEFLLAKLSNFFNQNSTGTSQLISQWAGIQGFTSDGMPLVGQLPKSFTNNDGNGEWIAAGFNGGGMCQCWLVGIAVTSFIRGEDVSGWFPEPFYVSDARLRNGLSVEASVESMKEYFPSHRA